MAQWNKTTQDFSKSDERSLFEVFNVATSDGQQVTETKSFSSIYWKYYSFYW
jgi:hypothetical protein